jgi:hypothetical protein
MAAAGLTGQRGDGWRIGRQRGWTMNSDRKDFLLVMQMLPARLDVQETAWYLGFMPHDIPVLVRAGLLQPLVRSPQAVKYFATVTLTKLREDTPWLKRASEAITKHWRAKNRRNSTESTGRTPDVLVMSRSRA